MDTGEPTGAAAAAAASAAGGEKRTMLLRKITEEGGFAFVASAEKAAGGDLRAAEAAREMAWEQLHSGPWSEVEPAWRHAYALACLHVASLRVGEDRRAALRALDMGLIMGGDLLRAELEAAIAQVPAEGNREGEGNGVGDAGRNVERWREGLSRNRDLGDVLKVLPVKSLSCKQIERRTCISLEAFIRDYFLRESPVILSGCIDHWPAMTKWKDIKYLERIAGDRTIPVEVGKNYVCNEWRQDLITFSQLLERMSSPDLSGNLTYLAQHPLFEQIKELREDVMVPEYCYAGGGELQSLNAWFGPHGTVTPLHHDPHHNLFAQVLGRKYIRLYHASISEDLYPHMETMLSNTSQVDLDNIDVEEFPRTEGLEFMDSILEEGDLLYIPPKWWHYLQKRNDGSRSFICLLRPNTSIIKLRNIGWTSDRLARRGLPHQDVCPLCDQHAETMQHLMLDCVFARQVWHWFVAGLGWPDFEPGGEETLVDWCHRQELGRGRRHSVRALCLLGLWIIWKHRNAVVFDGATPSVQACLWKLEEEGKTWVKAGVIRASGVLPWVVDER